MLARYAEALTPWAVTMAASIFDMADKQDRKVWAKATREMSRQMREEVNNTNVGAVAQKYIAEQVKLITSLPIEAGQRVHKLAMEGLSNAMRPEEMAKRIAETGEVTMSRAMTIARTESARAHTVLTRARAEATGVDKFMWQTVRDGRVRPSHKKLQGQIFEWSTPPETDPGIHALPGCVFNCRCFAVPQIWDKYK
jgi:SPP1 gp7 family putative phage head morphogenesis protein